LLADYPSPSVEDLKAAWDYVHSHTDEIEREIDENDAA